MTWDEYFENVSEWSVEMATKAIFEIEKLGAADEVAHAISMLAYKDKNVATMLLDRANVAGVKFTGEDIATMYEIDETESFYKALLFAADQFSTTDIEEMAEVVEDKLVVEVIKQYGIPLTEELEELYEEHLDAETAKPITWKTFYSKFERWSKEYAIRRLDGVTSYGKWDELLNVISELFYPDQEQANQFVRKVLATGKHFTGEQVVEFDTYCDKEVLEEIVLRCGHKYGNRDIENLKDCVDDTILVNIIKQNNIKLSKELAEEYEEQLDNGTDKPISWKEFYRLFEGWSEEYAARRLAHVTNYGSSSEILDVLYALFANDEKCASEYVRKALGDGIYFSADDIADLINLCDKETVLEVIETSAKKFTSKDINTLYGVLDDQVVIKFAKEYNLKLPKELEDEYEEQLDDGTNKPITWSVFYDRYGEWNQEYAIQRLQGVTSYGKTKEILEVLQMLFGIDDVRANDFVRKVLEAGVRFSADELGELANTCDEATVKEAVMHSIHRLNSDDLETLCDWLDDEFIIDIAKKNNLKLPAALQEAEEYSCKGVHDELLGAISSANNALEWLCQAQSILNNAGNLSVIDMMSKDRYASVLKYAVLEDAGRAIEMAQLALNSLKIDLKSIRMHSGTFAGTVDIWIDDGLMDTLTHLQIGKTQRNISRAIRQVESLRRKLISEYEKNEAL